MAILDVFYVALATLAVMGLLQLITYVAIRLMYPPEPKIIYRDVPMAAQAQPQFLQQGPVAVASHIPPPPPPQLFGGGPPPPPIETKPPPALTQQTQEIQLPEYEPRIAATSTSSRLDAGLPDGLPETRPPGL